MKRPIGQRHGFTLTELLITMAIVSSLIWLGVTTLRLDEIGETSKAAVDVVNLFRQARYVASRQNAAVVVVVRTYGLPDPSGSGNTRGRVEAYIQPGTTCPAGAWDPLALGLTPDLPPVDFGTFSGLGGSSEPGIARVIPNDLLSEHFCVRPNGRIINRFDNAPIRPAGANPADLAGKATIWVQYDPLRQDSAGNLIVPFRTVEVPYNGLVRVVE